MSEVASEELAAALDGFRLHVRTHGGDLSGEVAHPGDVARALRATLSRIAAGRSPGTPAPGGPRAGEAGRLADEAGRQVIVGICRGAVTLRTVGTCAGGAMTLDGARAEDFAQLFISACWQAAAQCDELAGAP